MPLHSVETVPPPEVVAVAVDFEWLPPELDEDAKPDADVDADAEEPLAVALAEELDELEDWAIASLPPRVRTSNRQSNAKFFATLIISTLPLEDMPFLFQLNEISTWLPAH